MISDQCLDWMYLGKQKCCLDSPHNEMATIPDSHESLKDRPLVARRYKPQKQYLLRS